MQQLTLHEDRFSGNAYKVRLAANLANVHIDKFIEYNMSKGETRTDDFRNRINANGRIPVLQVGTTDYLPESNAACYYIATGSQLVPSDPWKHAQMLQWMFFEQSFVEPTIGTLRYWYERTGEASFSDEQRAVVPGKRDAVESALQVMDGHLAAREFFVGDEISLADVILYAYVHLAPEAGFALGNWANVNEWCKRIASQPRFIRMEDQSTGAASK